MEIGRAAGESAQDRSFHLANVGELAIDQSLAEIGRGFTVVGRQTRSWVLLAYCDFW